MDTLQGRRVLFVEGKDADYHAFIRTLGDIHTPGFTTTTRKLTVFTTEGPSMLWPFDVVQAFESLMGVELSYVYLADRDFNTEEDIAAFMTRSTRERKPLRFLARRNRESYLLVPDILCRAIINKWNVATRGTVPPELTPTFLKDIILAECSAQEDSLAAKFDFYHDRKKRGSATEVQAISAALKRYFRESYSEQVRQGQIPYLLMDSKEVLRALRRQIAAKWSISFSDIDILKEYTAADIPADIAAVIGDIVALFEGS